MIIFMNRYAYVIVFVLCSVHVWAQPQSGIEKSRENAQKVLAFFADVKVDKILFTLTDSLYFVMLNTEDKKEFFVRRCGDSIIARESDFNLLYQDKKFKKQRKSMLKCYEKAQPIFDPLRYIHGSISWCPRDAESCVRQSRHYFQYVNANGDIILEYRTASIEKECQFINDDLFIYLLVRLVEED